MLDTNKSIVGQAIMKSLLTSPSFPSQIEGPAAQQAWIEEMFPYLTKKIEDYARLDTKPINILPAFTDLPPQHLADEQVARGVAKESGQSWPQERYQSPTGKTFAFCSEKQSKRAYALQKANGWQDYQVKGLAQKYGFQNTKKIPVGVYEAFCNELQQGPGNLNSSSAHLEQR